MHVHEGASSGDRRAQLLGRLRLFAGDIKVAHTIFALPFALLSAALAWRQAGGAIVGKLGLILACMVTARTLAMAANRLIDASLDALNPRTAARPIPSGRVSGSFYGAAIGLCAAAFIAATGGFLYYGNSLPLMLSVPVLVFLGVYPLLKRFTRLCHYYLGAALGLAPVCAWIAMGAALNLTPVLMGSAVLFWTAGFDIIYACQDCESDVRTGVVSAPAGMGIGAALWVARISHGVSAALLLALGWHTPQLGWVYLSGVAAVIVLLIVEHSLVRADDLSRAGVAFFTMNGIISVVLGTVGIVDAFC